MTTTNFIELIGYLTLVIISYKLLSFLWMLIHCYVLTSFGFVRDLKQYGEWAVVTGASDGIGKEYAKQLASHGFHVVLISRTLSKLEKVAREIEDLYGVKTKIICFDFSETHGYDRIEKEIADLDIGILINNVGWAALELELFEERSMDVICNMINTNCFSFVHMSHMVLKGMCQRQRGAIVYICAGAIYVDGFPIPVYAATKAFMATLVKTLQIEHNGVLTQQIVVPFGVASNLVKEKPGPGVLSAEDYVNCAIPTIGVSDYTHGCPSHELIGFMFQSLPKCFITFFVNKVLKPKLFKKKKM